MPQSEEDYRRRLVAFAHKRDFAFVSGILVEEVGGGYEFTSIDNMPLAYRNGGGSSSAARGRDPVMQHAKVSAIPHVWNQATYTSRGVGELWEEQASFGYKRGALVSMHMPNGRHFILGVDGDRVLPSDPVDLGALLGDLQLFAVYAHEGISVLFGKCSDDTVPALTAREMEVLKWTADGKTAEQIGEILSISGRTVVAHRKALMRKLGASNTSQAASKALRMGIIR